MRNFAFDLKPFARLASMSGRIEFLTFDYVFLFLFIFLFIWLRFYEWIFQFVGLKSFLITLSNPHKSFSLSLRTKRPKCADSRRVNFTRKQLWLKEISNNNEIETIWCELHFTGFFFYICCFPIAGKSYFSFSSCDLKMIVTYSTAPFSCLIG